MRWNGARWSLSVKPVKQEPTQWALLRIKWAPLSSLWHTGGRVCCMCRKVTVLTSIGTEINFYNWEKVIYQRREINNWSLVSTLSEGKWKKRVFGQSCRFCQRRQEDLLNTLSEATALPSRCSSVCATYFVSDYLHVFVCPWVLFVYAGYKKYVWSMLGLRPLKRMLFSLTTRLRCWGQSGGTTLGDTGAWRVFIITGLSLNSFPPMMRPTITGKIQ